MGNDSEISYPVFPELTQLRAFEGVTHTAWVFEADDPLRKKIPAPFCILSVKRRKFHFGNFIKLNGPDQAQPPLRPSLMFCFSGQRLY